MAKWLKAKVKSSVSLGFGFYKDQDVFAQTLTKRVLIFDGESRAKMISLEEAKNSIEFLGVCEPTISDGIDKKFFQSGQRIRR